MAGERIATIYAPPIEGLTTDQQERQAVALRNVELVAREIGRQIPVVSGEHGVSETPGLYVLDEITRQKGNMVHAEFAMEPTMLRGAADSAHAVLGGDMTVTYADGSVGVTKVAAKCYTKREFDQRLDRVRREIEFTGEMADRGELALEPIAVAIAPPHVAGHAVVLFTRLNDELYTLDGNPWGRGLTVQNVGVAVAAAQVVGHCNATGIEHDDAKIKNVGSLTSGKLGMVDFETSHRIDPTNVAEAQAAAHADFGLLIKSLDDKGLFRPRGNVNLHAQSQQIASAIRSICETGYLSAWESASADVQSAVIDVVHEIGQQYVNERAPLPVPL
jgi:hypothetical protein